MDSRLARPEWRGRTNVDALTIACIEHAEQIMRRRHRDIAHDFVVTQGSYQGGGGASASAGTHDLGGVVDIRWCGHDACVTALRRAGMAAWHRNPSQGPWPDHIHAVVIGHPLLSNAARAQVIDYFAGRNGLANHAPDDGRRLNPIPRPVWPWPPEEDNDVPMDRSQFEEWVSKTPIRTKVGEEWKDRPLEAVLADLETTQERINSNLRDIKHAIAALSKEGQGGTGA